MTKITDSIPPDKFIELFVRLSETVRLGRVRDSRDIRRRIKRVLDWYRHAYGAAKRSSTKARYRKRYKSLRKLYVAKNPPIHTRIWNEAAENPGGLVDLTLDHGYQGAKTILEGRARRRAGRMRRLRRG